MPLNCKSCGAPLKGDEEHCPYCGSLIDDVNGQKIKKAPERENKNLPRFKYASEIFVIVISIFTLGLYGIWWYISRRKSINAIANGSKFPDIGLVLYIIGWIMFLSFSSSDAQELDPESAENFVGYGYIILWAGALWMSFAIKKILKDYLAQTCKDEAIIKVINFSDVMIFIFGYIYLQMQINKMIHAEIFAPNL